MLRRFLACLCMCCGLLVAANAATVNVYMYNFQFSTDPTHATIVSPVIHVGDTVHWILDEGIHCTTSCAGMTESWASPMFTTAGQTFDHTFTTAGTFGYYCCLHGFDNGNGTAAGMAGTVTVLPAEVKGTVTLQNFSGTMPSVTVQVRNPGSSTVLQSHTVTPDANGNFTFPAPSAGTYDFSFKASHWLRKTLTNVNVTSSGASGLAPSLVNGDVNGDNAVTLGDFALLRAAFGSSTGEGSFNANADLNGDGSVTLGDFATLRSRFGQSGDN